MVRRRPFPSGAERRRREPTNLSDYVGELRQKISDLLPNTSPVGVSQNNPDVAAAVAGSRTNCGLDDAGAEQAVEYVLEGRAVLGAVPTQTTIIAERFFDEAGGMQLIIHAPFGGRINKAWGLALRKRFCRGFNFELQAAATDNGLNIALAEQHSFPLADVFQFLTEHTVPELLEQASLASPIFGTRWRWDANRALALLRFQGGKEGPATDPTDAIGRSAGVGVSGCGGVPGKYRGRYQDSGPSADSGSDEGRVDKRRWTLRD